MIRVFILVIVKTSLCSLIKVLSSVISSLSAHLHHTNAVIHHYILLSVHQIYAITFHSAVC